MNDVRKSKRSVKLEAAALGMNYKAAIRAGLDREMSEHARALLLGMHRRSVARKAGKSVDAEILEASR